MIARINRVKIDKIKAVLLMVARINHVKIDKIKAVLLMIYEAQNDKNK